MSDEPDNLILRYLRRLDAKLDRVIDDLRDLSRQVGVPTDRLSNIDVRLERTEIRLGRIERRLDLINRPTT